MRSVLLELVEAVEGSFLSLEAVVLCACVSRVTAALEACERGCVIV